MAKGRRSRGARYGSDSLDHSLDSRIGSARPRGHVRRTSGAEVVRRVEKRVVRSAGGMESWPLSNIQKMIIGLEEAEARRKDEVSRLLGKGTCISFNFGTNIRATPHKNAGNSRWKTKIVEGKDFLSQVICPSDRSLRCASCILNCLEDGASAEAMRNYFSAEVEVAVGVDLAPDWELFEDGCA